MTITPDITPPDESQDSVKLTDFGHALLANEALHMDVWRIVNEYIQCTFTNANQDDRDNAEGLMWTRLLGSEQNARRFAYILEEGLTGDAVSHLRAYCVYAFNDVWDLNAKTAHHTEMIEERLPTQSSFLVIDPNPEDMLIQQQQVEQIQRIICTVELSESLAQYRDLMLEGHSLKEIAKMLDIQVSAARRRSYRLREHVMCAWRRETFFEHESEQSRIELWELFQEFDFTEPQQQSFQEHIIRGLTEWYIRGELRLTRVGFERLKEDVCSIVVVAWQQQRNL